MIDWAEDDLRWVMDGDLAPMDDEINAAAQKWCGDKDRETFMSDVYYFRENWHALNGLKAYVAREVSGRARRAQARMQEAHGGFMNHLVDRLCSTPLIEDLSVSLSDWESCATVGDVYDMTKRKIRDAFEVIRRGGPA